MGEDDGLHAIWQGPAASEWKPGSGLTRCLGTRTRAGIILRLIYRITYRIIYENVWRNGCHNVPHGRYLGSSAGPRVRRRASVGTSDRVVSFSRRSMTGI